MTTAFDWKQHFPTPGDTDACRRWKPLISRYPLARCVLAVALTRIEGTWAAYIDAVPGLDHGREVAGVMRTGNKLPEPVARALFPAFEAVAYAE